MPTNPDVLAFHEGFADIVAILQHFTYPEVVAEHIAATRGDLTDRTVSETSPLLSLASQFGYAIGRRDAVTDRPDEPRQERLHQRHRGA